MSIKVPKKFSKGGTLTADRLNELRDCLSEVVEALENGEGEITAGAGLTMTPNGKGKVISLLNFSKGGAVSGKSSSTGSSGALNFPFKASVSDGILTIARGYVLVKPHSLSYGGGKNAGIKFSKTELATTQKLSIPLKTYSFAEEYPESEIAFLKSVTAQRSTTEASFTIAVPDYTASATTETISFTATTGATLITEIHSFLTTVDKIDASLSVDGRTTELLVHVGETDPYTETVRLGVGISGESSETVQVKSLTGVTLTKSGETSQAVKAEIPAYEIATELLDVKPLTGGSLKEGETEMATVDVELAPQVYAPEEVEEWTADSDGSTELINGSEKDGVYFLEVPEFSCAANEGTVAILKITLSDGDGATFEWETSTMDEIAGSDFWKDKETRQVAEISVKGSLSTRSETPVFGVAVSVSGSEFFAAKSAYPIASVSDGSALQLHGGVLVYTPPLELSLNYAGGGASELNLASVVARAFDGRPIFNLEEGEYSDALNTKIEEGSE